VVCARLATVEARRGKPASIIRAMERGGLVHRIKDSMRSDGSQRLSDRWPIVPPPPSCLEQQHHVSFDRFARFVVR
jgi:hypothetical protein